MSPDDVVKAYGPRCLPSGWTNLTGGRPVMRDNTVSMVYGGFGLRVWVRLTHVVQRGSIGWVCVVTVEDAAGKDLPLSALERVMLELFRSSHWGPGVREMWYQMFKPAALEANKTWSFCSEFIPLNFDCLPGIQRAHPGARLNPQN